MKKIFNFARVLIIAGILLAVFMSCSSPNGGDSSGDSASPVKTDPSSKAVIAKYKTETGYKTDYIIAYEDGTYEEIWCGELWSKGKYVINYGDMLNGSVTTTVIWAHSGLKIKAGDSETFTIIEGAFTSGTGYLYKLEDGKVSQRKKLITYKATINGYSDYVLIYDDGTWAETYAGMFVFSKGTYTITNGDIENGTIKMIVSWADLSISLKPGDYTVEIKNASFNFNGYTYTKK